MKIGTKSILFGAHCFFIHPLFVALAWWKLYGFPFDPRLWVAFFVHDLGYWGKPNMDGPEGETHPELGGEIMHFMFDSTPWLLWCPNPECYDGFVIDTFFNYISDEWKSEEEECPVCKERREYANRWRNFTIYHSRFYAKAAKRPHSKLCAADKLATCLEPRWLYLLKANLTGEIKEYMGMAGEGKYQREESRMWVLKNSTGWNQKVWHGRMTEFMREWAYKNK